MQSSEAAGFRFWHKADIPLRSINVRFWGQSGHSADPLRCPLLTQSRHRDPVMNLWSLCAFGAIILRANGELERQYGSRGVAAEPWPRTVRGGIPRERDRR